MELIGFSLLILFCLGVKGASDPKFGRFRHAAVVAPVSECSKIGTDILKQGGSTVDAAIASVLCVGVINLHNSGIGGGHFMTVYAKPRHKTRKVLKTILARERAPGLATKDMFVNGTASSLRGGKAIGIPGEIKGFYTAWRKFGQLPWRKLFAPAIKLCKRGFIVNEDLAMRAQSLEDNIRAIPSMRELLIKNDQPVKEGDHVKNRKLGRTLQTIANNPRAFYDPNSQLAKDIVADIEDADGIITLQDLADYEVYVKDPLSVYLANGDLTVYGPRPPSGAAIVQFILNILDGYGFKKQNLIDTNSQVLTYHRITEAWKYAFAKRTQLGDEEFTDVVELLANLTSKEFGEATRAKIDDSQTFNISHYEPVFDTTDDGGTTHVSVIGPDGSAVSVTSTINFFFGSFVRGSRTGIHFNNEMDDFSTPGLINAFGFRPSPANFIEPGKMPLSSMSPTIIVDKNDMVVYVSGGAGGSRIITSISYVAVHALWFDMPLDEATNRPRLHNQLAPNLLEIEEGFDEDVRAGLEAKGHVIGSFFYSDVQSILSSCHANKYKRENNEKCIQAAVDARASGLPAGI